MKAIHWLVTLPLAVILVIFAVSNREPVALALWPFQLVLEAPLYLVSLLMLLVGFLIGEFVAWVNGRRWRRDARHMARRLEALERELAATQSQLQPSSAAVDAGPRLPATRIAVPGAPRL